MRRGTSRTSSHPRSRTLRRPTESYDEKFESLARTIAAIDFDVISVQKVGRPPLLDDFATSIGGTRQYAVAGPDGRGIRVGILSRRVLHDVE